MLTRGDRRQQLRDHRDAESHPNFVPPPTTDMATTTHLLDEQDDVFDQPPAAAAPTQQHEQPPANPAVALLKSMFPDFDDMVLQSVLDSVNGNQDAAVDVLLGMSDPSYVSTHHAVRHYCYFGS